jgi:hypothetical protein
MGPDGARYQERLCWRGPAAIYWTALKESLESAVSIWETDLSEVVAESRPLAEA